MRGTGSGLGALATVCVIALAAAPYGAAAGAQEIPAAAVAPGPAGSPAAADEPVRLERLLVTLNVTVQDPYGRFVSGLSSSRFTVYADRVEQPIAFFSQEDAPVTVGIVCDMSGSMKSKARRALLALRRFLETCHRDDEYFLVGFGERVELLRDLTSDPSLVDHLTFVEPRGKTALYDAAVAGIEKAREGRHSKRALLIVTDGQDNASRYTYREFRELVKESDVLVYGLGIADRNDPLRELGEKVLEQVCRVSGGRAYFPSASEHLADYCNAIALELRHQYSIGFYPSDNAAGRRWHKVKVKLESPAEFPGLKVRTREGYFGPRGR